MTVGPAGAIYYGGQVGFDIQIYRPSGSTSVGQPGTNGLGEYDFALDASGNIYASGGHQVARSRRRVPGPSLREPVRAGSRATAVPLPPRALRTGRNKRRRIGSRLIADRLNNRIRQVDLNGTITTVAGNGTIGFSGDGGLAVHAELYLPDDVAFDTGGAFWIADTLNWRVRRVGLP